MNFLGVALGGLKHPPPPPKFYNEQARKLLEAVVQIQLLLSCILYRAAPIPLFTDTLNTKYSAGKYLQVKVLIPSTLK